jgi:hypothetical protein
MLPPFLILQFLNRMKRLHTVQTTYSLRLGHGCVVIPKIFAFDLSSFCLFPLSIGSPAPDHTTLDEIHYLPPKPPVYDILGGAGAYSALGARLFSPPPSSRTVSWIVDEGSDFPAAIRDQISAWETSCLIRSDASRLTTRGWNGYDENQNRGFKYTTPKLRLDENSLTDTLLFSKSFHLICSPSRCIALTNSILRKRKRLNPYAPKPIFIWEPVPDLCIPTELLNTTNALPYGMRSLELCIQISNGYSRYLLPKSS